MPLFLALFFGYIPAFINAGIVYWVDRYEKEPRLLLIGVFMWGAVVASGAAFLINTLLGMGVYFFTSSESATDLTTGSIIAPFIEESLKGAAVLLVYWRARKEFDSVLDGVVYAAVTALGFAATENVYYIYQYGYMENGLTGLFFLAFVRVILVGWQHPFYTAFIGIGLAVARLSPSRAVKILAVLFGYVMAVATHSLHNTMAFYSKGLDGLFSTTAIDWTGWLAMVVFVVVITRREHKLLVRYLGEEMQFGTLTLPQFQTACSPSDQWRTRLFAIQGRRYGVTTRFYKLCAEIAHKKNHYAQLGNETDNLAAIDALRAELRQLSPLVPAVAR